MLHCWNLGRPTAREVHEASLELRRRDYRTVLATLTNIAAKGYLEVEKVPGPRNIPTNRYVPTLPKREAMERRIRTFLRDDLRWEPESIEQLRDLLRRRD